MTGDNFYDQLEKGKQGEDFLDNYFSKGYTIKETDRALDKLGIDRIYIDDDGARTSIEYKTDVMAGKTGNMFVETETNETKKGWAFTSLSQRMIFLIPNQKIIIYATTTLREKVKNWIGKYPEKKAKATTGLDNGWSFQSSGVLVPISEFEKHACNKIILENVLPEKRI